MLTWTHPVEGEYLPYQKAYLDKVPDGDLIEILKNNVVKTSDFLRQLSDEQILYRYAEGKWNIKEILQHIIDTERIMSYRALRFARKDATALPGFEQDDYVANANTDERDFIEMILEFFAVRTSTVYLFNSFNDELMEFTAIANKGPVKVKSFAYVIATEKLLLLTCLLSWKKMIKAKRCCAPTWQNKIRNGIILKNSIRCL